MNNKQIIVLHVNFSKHCSEQWSDMLEGLSYIAMRVVGGYNAYLRQRTVELCVVVVLQANKSTEICICCLT